MDQPSYVILFASTIRTYFNTTFYDIGMYAPFCVQLNSGNGEKVLQTYFLLKKVRRG
jgi:hypothetical protein